MKHKFKTYCLLANGEVRTCYPFDYGKGKYDYRHPRVKLYGDHYVFVEEITTIEGIKGECLSYIKGFADTVEELKDE